MSISAELWESFRLIGGTFAAVSSLGTVFQIAYFRKEQGPAVNAALSRWFDWVRDWKYSYFAQEEASKFVEILDRYASPNLWSWKRWCFSLISAGICGLIASLAALLSTPSISDIESVDFVAFAFVAVYSAALAFSISLTRFAAELVTRVSMSRLASVAALVLLLAFHIFLFIYWSRIVFWLCAIPLVLGGAAVMTDQLIEEWKWLSTGQIINALGELAVSIATEAIAPIEVGDGEKSYARYIVVYLKVLVDILANGIRVGFILVFLGSYLTPLAVQKPLENAWSYAAGSDKPLLGVVFGVAAAVLVTLWEAVYWIARAIGYVVGLF